MDNNLRIKKMDVVNVFPVSNGNKESVMHLFINCVFAKSCCPWIAKLTTVLLDWFIDVFSPKRRWV